MIYDLNIPLHENIDRQRRADSQRQDVIQACADRLVHRNPYIWRGNLTDHENRENQARHRAAALARAARPAI